MLKITSSPIMHWGGGPCDFSVTLGFGIGTWDYGLTIIVLVCWGETHPEVSAGARNSDQR